MATPTLERIDLVDHSEAPPELVCAFFWSASTGLTCSDPERLAVLAETGIAAPPEGQLVFPRDGKRFFDSLLTQFSGAYLRAEKKS